MSLQPVKVLVCLCCALQHFCAFDDDGQELEHRCKDLTSEEGRAEAGRFLKWLQRGQPGWVSARGGRKAVGGLVSDQ
jgi:hypothetical protein